MWNDVSRPPSAEEYQLIQWLLIRSGPQAKAFFPQLEEVQVCGVCTCGCPTIHLMVPEHIPAVTSGGRLLGDCVGEVNGVDVGVLLFQANGRLSMLEIYAFGENPSPFPLPEASRLVAWENLSQRRPDGLKTTAK